MLSIDLQLFIIFCYNAFYFCENNSNIPSFIPDINNLILLSFFLEINVAKDVSILLTFSENQLLVFFIFPVVFLSSVPFIFALLIISVVLMALSSFCFI